MLINKRYHDAKANGSGYCDLGEFFPVWFCAPALMKLILIYKKQGRTRKCLCYLLINLTESLANCLRGSKCCWIWSMVVLDQSGRKNVSDARWSYLQKPPEWAAPTHYAAVGLRCKGQGCLYTGNIARQGRTQVQQWRVVTVRRCTAARQTSQPAERKRKRTTSSVCCLLLLQWEYPAGWLGWLEGGEGGVGGAPGQQLDVYLLLCTPQTEGGQSSAIYWRFGSRCLEAA